MIQERAIGGCERYLAELGRVQAEINREIGAANVHEERARTERETARVHRAQARLLTAQKRGILERLGMPPDLDTFDTDWDLGIYRWKQTADDNGGEDHGTEHVESAERHG